MRPRTRTQTRTFLSFLFLVNYSPNLCKQGTHNLSTKTESAECRDEWIRGFVRKTDGSSNMHLSSFPFIALFSHIYSRPHSLLSVPVLPIHTETSKRTVFVNDAPKRIERFMISPGGGLTSAVFSVTIKQFYNHYEVN